MQSSDLSTRAEVSIRIASAANAWLKLSRSNFWGDSHISRGIKCTLYKVIVQSTLIYANMSTAHTTTAEAGCLSNEMSEKDVQSELER